MQPITTIRLERNDGIDSIVSGDSEAEEYILKKFRKAYYDWSKYEMTLKEALKIQKLRKGTNTFIMWRHLIGESLMS